MVQLKSLFVCIAFLSCLNCQAQSGSNPLNALDIRDFGGRPNARIPASGKNATGTDNTPALQAMLNTAADGQLCVVPDGDWLFSTTLDSIKGPKRVNLLILGNTFHNGSDFIILTNAKGQYEQHNIEHAGIATGRLNMRPHTKSTHDNGTGPDWNALTGTCIKIFNTSQQTVRLNKANGFKQPVEIIGSGDGSQENTVFGRSFRHNANGITLTSLNGTSYCDKNKFYIDRISGGLGIKIDGNSRAASNGERYNGAFRSNEFYVMIEEVDSIAECHGDITEPRFYVTVEAGKNTGVFGKTGWRMRSVSPNYVRSPLYDGRGIYESSWLTNGLGVNGKINTSVWNGSVYYGNNALIDEEGMIVFLRASSLPKYSQDGAPSNFRFVAFGEVEGEDNITASTYTVAHKVRFVYYNHVSGTVTMPAARTSVGRYITVFNDNKASLTVSNVKGFTAIPGQGVMTFRSNGTLWRAIDAK